VAQHAFVDRERKRLVFLRYGLELIFDVGVAAFLRNAADRSRALPVKLRARAI
jgi:hypothetical protein